MYEYALGPVDRVTCGSTWRTQQRCGCSGEPCVRRSCAAGGLPACAGVDESWTPPRVSNTLSKGHKCIPSRASGLVQIAKALTDADYSSKVGLSSLKAS